MKGTAGGRRKLPTTIRPLQRRSIRARARAPHLRLCAWFTATRICIWSSRNSSPRPLYCITTILTLHQQQQQQRRRSIQQIQELRRAPPPEEARRSVGHDDRRGEHGSAKARAAGGHPVRHRRHPLRFGSLPLPRLPRAAAAGWIQRWGPHQRGVLQRQHQRLAQRRPRRPAVPGARPRQGHGVHGSEGSTLQKVGGRTAQGTGRPAGSVHIDRRPQPEARSSDERAESERRVHAVAPRAHQLLPGARHRERVRESQAVPGSLPQGPRAHRRFARSHLHIRGLCVGGPGRRRRRRGRGGPDNREPREGAEGRGSELADRGFSGPEAAGHASGAGPCTCR